MIRPQNTYILYWNERQHDSLLLLMVPKRKGRAVCRIGYWCVLGLVFVFLLSIHSVHFESVVEAAKTVQEWRDSCVTFIRGVLRIGVLYLFNSVLTRCTHQCLRRSHGLRYFLTASRALGRCSQAAAVKLLSTNLNVLLWWSYWRWCCPAVRWRCSQCQ